MDEYPHDFEEADAQINQAWRQCAPRLRLEQQTLHQDIHRTGVTPDDRLVFAVMAISTGCGPIKLT